MTTGKPVSHAEGGPRGRPAVFRRTEPILVRQPVDGDVRAVRETVRASVGDASDPLTSAFLPHREVYTLTVFLEERPDSEPALVWYLEVPPGSSDWNAPAAQLLVGCPLFGDGLLPAVDVGASVVYGRGDTLVHARMPDRPEDTGDHDVVLVRLGLRSGIPRWATWGIDRLLEWLGGTWVEQRLAAEAEEILAAEQMWTETLFLVENAEILWYMETADMATTMRAYEEATGPLAGVSDWLAERLVGRPLSELGDPAMASDCEVLVHATAAARP